MSSPTKQSSPRAMAVLAALGLVVGLAIARLRLKLPKLLKGG